MTIELEGILINVERKKIKNLHIHIKPPYGEVYVTAPMRMKESEIKEFVYSKTDWILKNVDKMTKTNVTPEPDYVTGDLIPIWGDIYTLEVRGNEFLTDGRKKFEIELESEDTVVLYAPFDATKEEKEAYFLEWYRKELYERADILIPLWEKYTGLYCSSWQSKNMKTRWGTCNTKTNKVWLNVQLAKYPVECLEYVILHELAHTRVPNHGPEFKAILNEYMPDWKEKRKRLRE